MVLKVPLKHKDHGVNALTITKKRRYWSWGICGNELSSHFLIVSVGISGLMIGSYNCVDFKFIFCMNEPEYHVSKFMPTFGLLTVVNKHNTIFVSFKMNRQKFKLIEQSYFQKMSKDCVNNDHNHLRQQLPTLETTCRTFWCPNIVFALLLDIREINITHLYECSLVY